MEMDWHWIGKQTLPPTNPQVSRRCQRAESDMHELLTTMKAGRKNTGKKEK